MTDALRLELAPWGIHVAIVEPGTIKTPIWTRERPQPPEEAVPLYGERLDAFRHLAVRRGSAGAPPEVVANAVEHALTSEKPRTRYLVGRDAKLRARVERLPDRLRDRVIARRVLGS
jgi:NAD(P)-dependent dehydrogenase (short-subunit alcohol dehydrogenase family)